MDHKKQLRDFNVTENDLKSILDDFSLLERKFLSDFKTILEIGNGNVHRMDLYTAAIVNRAISFMRGFALLTTENNYISAIPVIRMQVDNCLRFFAATIVSDFNNFFEHYLNGEHIGNLKDSDGKRMTDSNLVESLDKIFPGIKILYKNTSGYIHFSNEHTFLQTEIIQNKGSIGTRVGYYDFFSIDKKVDFAYNMKRASEILLALIDTWREHKLKMNLSNSTP